MDVNKVFAVIFFVLFIIGLSFDVMNNDLTVDIFLALVQFIFVILGLFFSILTVKNGKLVFGITFSLVFSVILIFFAFAFTVFLVNGVLGSAQQFATLGNAIAKIF